MKNIIGIWGYGKTGKALKQYFLADSSVEEIYILSNVERDNDDIFCEVSKVKYYLEKDFEDWFSRVVWVYVSPGIDITNYYQKLKDKLKNEVDLFFALWPNKTVAITGSVGKTSATTFLSHALQNVNISTIVGGNIGTPLCELLNYKDNTSFAIVELSSFQLEYSNACQPDVAVITNLDQNHLDRHKTYKSYWKAKSNIFINQKKGQFLLVPYSLYEMALDENPKSTIAIFLHNPSTFEIPTLLALSHKHHIFIAIDHCQSIFHISCGSQTLIGTLPTNKKTFDENILIIAAVAFLLNISLSADWHTTITPLDHRLSCIGTYNEIEFYNDSKATVMKATIAAVNQLNSKPIILILGGISKGVNRAPYIKELHTKVNFIVTFGKEATELFTYAHDACIPATACMDLESAFEVAIKQASSIKPAIILFSPGGSSYDFFTDYQHRGTVFTQMVTNFIARKDTMII